MHAKLEIAKRLYEFLQEHNYDLSEEVKSFKDIFELTVFEAEGADEEFRKFLKANDLLKESIDKYDIIPPFEIFKYNIDRLKTHLKVTNWLYKVMWDIKLFNFNNISEELGYEDEGELESDLSVSQEKVIYEQALVSLVAIFEAFINETLVWIYNNDVNAVKKIKVYIDCNEILTNMNSEIGILDVLIDNYVTQQNWSRKIEAFKNKPIGIKWKDINNAFAEIKLSRNLLIHNKGKVNKRYLKELDKLKMKCNYNLGQEIVIDKSYYEKAQDSILRLAESIDLQVKKKYL